MKPEQIDRSIKEVNDLVVKETIRCAIQAVRNLRSSRENSLAITKLEEALMWFEKGMVEK